MQLTHPRLWVAIDALAARYGLSPSGLAKRAGLDPTTFNRSKRVAPDGRQRWPNTESVAKVLEATGASLDEFLALVSSAGPERYEPMQPIPLIGFAQAGGGGFFDDGGFPVGGGWDQIRFPEVKDHNAYALEVTGDSMLPLYREGDVLIVSPEAQVRRGDRVVIRTLDGEVMAKVLARKTARNVELASLNPEHANLVFPLERIDWMARIVWASQ
jgi:phage repressor protein C with HTH and peptisase S24 domain